MESVLQHGMEFRKQSHSYIGSSHRSDELPKEHRTSTLTNEIICYITAISSKKVRNAIIATITITIESNQNLCFNNPVVCLFWKTEDLLVFSNIVKYLIQGDMYKLAIRSNFTVEFSLDQQNPKNRETSIVFT